MSEKENKELKKVEEPKKAEQPKKVEEPKKAEEFKRFNLNVGEKDKPETCFNFSGPEGSNLWQIYDAIITIKMHIIGKIKEATTPKKEDVVKPKEEVSE